MLHSLFSFSRFIVASLVTALFLAACGGGGNDDASQVVPTGAKVCELKEILVSRFSTYSNGEVVWDVGTQPRSTLAESDGRHQIWFWPGPTWVSVNSSTYTLAEGYRRATDPTEGIVPFDGTITLSADLSYEVSYAHILGFKDGIPLIGSRQSISHFGVAGAVEREPRSNDVSGLQAERRFVSLQAPVITVMSENVLQVSKSLGIGNGPSPNDVKFDFFLLEDCYHCGKTTTWSCQIHDLSPGDLVAITGIPRNQGFRFFANLFATTVLDSREKAISDSDSVLLSF